MSYTTAPASGAGKVLCSRSERVLFVALLVALVVGASVMVAAAQGPQGGPKSPAALPDNGFTYQGLLKNNGALVNGTCDFEFGLWDGLAAGPQYGATQTVSALAVTTGLFTTLLNFGVATPNTVFTGTARYLQTNVRCPAGGGSYTALSPRQALTPAPMALALPGLYTQQNITSPNVIGGFKGNVITPTLYGATISGGGSDLLPNRALGNYATVGGGQVNTAQKVFDTVGGGQNNVASGGSSTVSGGVNNNATGVYATVSGGAGHDASGDYAVIPGGFDNTAVTATLAAGNRARAMHQGAFVWGDYTQADINSSGNNQFIVRANGGIAFITSTVGFTPNFPSDTFITTTTGAKLTKAGVWTDVSDRNAKIQFQSVNPQAVLAQVAGLPITTWSYKAEDAAIRHIGPTAQDFYNTFNVGNDDMHLAALDTNGVALAAIQGLYQVVQEELKVCNSEISDLESQVASQRAQLDELEARLAALEQAGANRAPWRDIAGTTPTHWYVFGGLVAVGFIAAWRRG